MIRHARHSMADLHEFPHDQTCMAQYGRFATDHTDASWEAQQDELGMVAPEACRGFIREGYHMQSTGVQRVLQ